MFKRKLKALIVLMVIVVFASIGFATTTEKGKTVMLTALSADFTYSGNCQMWGMDGKGVPLEFILFIPGASNDVLVIKEATDSGPVIFYAVCADTTDQRIIYYGGNVRHQPVLDYSDSSLSSGHKVIFQLR